MSEPHDGHTTLEDADQPEPVRYPTNHVLAVFDTEDQVTAAAEALTSGGFLPGEINIECGAAAADHLRENTGRRGLAGLAIKIADKLGLPNSEMENKEQYEKALRDGRFVLRVGISDDARKEMASRILHDTGATSVQFFGRFAISTLSPPADG